MQKIELQNENCFTYLPKLERNSIDLIIIDPPYEVSRDTNFTSGKPKGKDTKTKQKLHRMRNFKRILQ